MRLIRQSPKKRYWKKLSTLASLESTLLLTLESELNILVSTCADQIWFETVFGNVKWHTHARTHTHIRFKLNCWLHFISFFPKRELIQSKAMLREWLPEWMEAGKREIENYCVIITSLQIEEWMQLFLQRNRWAGKSWIRPLGHFRYCRRMGWNRYATHGKSSKGRRSWRCWYEVKVCTSEETR